MKKIMWISDGLNINSGYGIQTAGILKALAQKYEVYHMSFQYHGQPLKLNNVWLLPNGYDMWGNDIVKQHVDSVKPDYIVTLMDLFRPCKWLKEQDKYLKQHGAKTIAYFPLDGKPLPYSSLDPVNVWEQFDYLIPMSMFGQETLLRELPEVKPKVTNVIWHGIDTNIFKPKSLKENQFYQANRKILDSKKFIVSSVFRNINRKNPMALIYAWKTFSKDKDDVLLILHTNPNEKPGTNLARLVLTFGLQKEVMFTGSDMLFFSQPAEFVADIYNASNVHVLATTGEGFGIPIVEAMACGKPNIVTDYTTSDELLSEGKHKEIGKNKYVRRGCLVPYTHKPTSCPETTQRGFIDWKALADALQFYYTTSNNQIIKLYQDKCSEYAQETFDWSVIHKQWLKQFERFENGQA